MIMATTTTTTLKIPQKLKSRIARLARMTGRTPHGFMVEALERQTSREEHLHAFVKEALAADRDIDDGGEVYAAEDVHSWLDRLAAGSKTSRPKAWRG